MKFRRFIEIIEANGFQMIRQTGSHRQFEGRVKGQRRMVTVAYHNINDDILPGNLGSMIRQSALPKELFR